MSMGCILILNSLLGFSLLFFIKSSQQPPPAGRTPTQIAIGTVLILAIIFGIDICYFLTQFLNPGI